MKHVFTLMLFFGIFSCNIDQPEYSDLHTSNNFPQKWELVQVRFPSENLQQKGLKMAWQESYLLLPDSTFLKKRMTPAETITAEGKFYTEKENNEIYIRFEFYKSSEKPANGIFSKNERLLKIDDDVMVLTSEYNGKKQMFDYKLK